MTPPKSDVSDAFPPEPPRTPRPPASAFSPLAHALVLAGATAAVFLAGKPQEGAMGIFLLCAGAAMLVCPPQIKVGWRLWLVVAALVGCAALTLLPASLLPQPAWRRTLDTTPHITMPGTISPTPALTTFWLALLALSLFVGLFLLAHPIRSRWLIVLTLAATLSAAVYGGLSIYAKQTGWHYPFTAEAEFGFFPNRNHTASLLFVGGLLALGCLGVVLREGRWLLGLLAGGSLVVCGAGLAFYSASRGGIVFLLVGICLWFAGLGRRRYDTRLVVSFVALLAAGGALFFLSGGVARDRLLGRSASSAPANVAPTPPPGDTSDERVVNTSEDFRLKIYRDTAGVIRDFPFTGMGLGNFALVFPQYRRDSLEDSRVLHPESDWLMFTAEAGVPVVLCLLVLVVLAAARLRGETSHPYWPLRWGCAVAAGAAALHGVVDVPLHRVQLGWWVLAVGGLALQSFQSGRVGRSRVQHALFIVAGLGALGLGGALVRAQWSTGESLPPFAVGAAEKQVDALYSRQDAQGAMTLAQETLKAYPMSAPLYLKLGFLLLQFQNTDAETDEVFKVQRLLDPNWSLIPLQQGDAWMGIDPDRTASLWLEALTRRQRINRAAGRWQDDAVGLYTEILGRAAKVPEVRRKLVSVATRSPAYAFAWLDNAGPQIDPADWDFLANSADLLKRFSEKERQRFLLQWHDKGDRAALARFLGEHPDWDAAAWPLHLRQLTEARQFEAAVREAAGRYHVSLDLPAPNPAVAALGPSDEEGDPARAFTQYWSEGNTIGARRVLAEASAKSDKPRNAEYFRLKAALAIHDIQWPDAWASLRQAIALDHPDAGL